MNENSIIKYIICMIIHLRKHQVLNYLIWKELILNCIIRKKDVKLQRILRYMIEKIRYKKTVIKRVIFLYVIHTLYFVLRYTAHN